MTKNLHLLIVIFLVAFTQPTNAPAAKPFHFFILGDWGRRGKPAQWAIAQQMRALAAAAPPAFIITTGDNFYQNGVRSVKDPHWNVSWTNVYKELTTQYDWYPSLGNHDYQGSGANPQAQVDYHKVNPHWKMDGMYYTVVVTTGDGQKVRFLFIDTNPLYDLYYKTGECPLIRKQDTAAQWQWIRNTLANAKEEWKFVVGHHPVYSGRGDNGITPELISKLKPLMQQYHVQAYIAGHDHSLQHLQPKDSYVDYFVCGAGGQTTSVTQLSFTKYAAAKLGFGDIAIRNDSLFLSYIGKNGEVLYSYARRR